MESVSSAETRKGRRLFSCKTGGDPGSLEGNLAFGRWLWRRAVFSKRWRGEGHGCWDRYEPSGGGHGNVHIVQADIFDLPLRHAVFDLIFSIGVLHHTPGTKSALSKLISLLNQIGIVGIWFYPRWSAVLQVYNLLLHPAANRLKSTTLNRVGVALEPIGLLKLKLLMSDRRWRREFGRLRAPTIGVSCHPDREIRVHNTFEPVAPAHQWHHTDLELESWMQECGLIEITNLSNGQEHYQFNYGNGVNFRTRRSAAGTVISG
jgi:hypothetical protein